MAEFFFIILLIFALISFLFDAILSLVLWIYDSILAVLPDGIARIIRKIVDTIFKWFQFFLAIAIIWTFTSILIV